MDHSIVIPVHNEAANLYAFVTSFVNTWAPPTGVAEILLVENGSTDETAAVCRRLEGEFPRLIVASSLSVASYGEAIKSGILQSRGRFVSILECDCLDPDFVSRAVRLLESRDASFVVASKRHPASIDRRPLKRRVLTAVYNQLLLGLIFGYPGSDTHGLKSIEAGCAKRLCELAVTSGETFQTELVLLAWRLGIGIREVPIEIRETRPAPVSVIKRVPKVLHTVQQLRMSLNRFPPSARDVLAYR
jgi:glycosyltransferase involved in cell wall biosynthesis